MDLKSLLSIHGEFGDMVPMDKMPISLAIPIRSWNESIDLSIGKSDPHHPNLKKIFFEFFWEF